MNIIELKNIIELAKNCSMEIPADTIKYFFKIYLPLSEAIAKNNKTVIKYLLNCEAADRLNIHNAIKDGAERLNLLKAYKLRGIIKKDKKRFHMANA